MSTRLSGNLAKLNFSDIIEATCRKAKSCQLIVRNAVGEGTIFFSQGEPFHAQMGKMEGQDAVNRLLASIQKEGGVFTVDFDIKIPNRTISKSWDEIVDFSVTTNSNDNDNNNGNSRSNALIVEDRSLPVDRSGEEQRQYSSVGTQKGRGECVNKLLTELQKKSSDIEGTAVVSTEGLVIASVLNKSFEEEHLAAISAIVLSLGERIVTELSRGALEQVYVKGKKGYVLITWSSAEALLVVIAPSVVKLGMIFLDTKRTAAELAQFL